MAGSTSRRPSTKGWPLVSTSPASKPRPLQMADQQLRHLADADVLGRDRGVADIVHHPRDVLLLALGEPGDRPCSRASLMPRPFRRIRAPEGWTSPVQPGGTSVVVSSWVRIIGPPDGVPAARAAALDDRGRAGRRPRTGRPGCAVGSTTARLRAGAGSARGRCGRRPRPAGSPARSAPRGRSRRVPRARRGSRLRSASGEPPQSTAISPPWPLKRSSATSRRSRRAVVHPARRPAIRSPAPRSSVSSASPAGLIGLRRGRHGAGELGLEVGRQQPRGAEQPRRGRHHDLLDARGAPPGRSRAGARRRRRGRA